MLNELRYNYRIDHLAWRVANRKKAVDFFTYIGYNEVTQFKIDFDSEDDYAICSVMEPNDRIHLPNTILPWATMVNDQRYVLSPEIFISEGSPNSIVDRWVKEHGNGVHHAALQIPEDSTVEEEMQKWLKNGWCERFTSEQPFHCENMSQCFSEISSVTGIIFELIKRKEAGFCKDSVRKLISSTDAKLK